MQTKTNQCSNLLELRTFHVQKKRLAKNVLPAPCRQIPLIHGLLLEPPKIFLEVHAVLNMKIKIALICKLIELELKKKTQSY